jgi:hypothetical protein
MLSLVIFPGVLFAETFPLVDTGQTRCYSTDGVLNCPSENQTFHGQDAQYQGHQPIYTDNGDGTITDEVTGLLWQKAFSEVHWADAAAAAAATTTGGYTDWRVPSIKELYSLINYTGVTGQGANPSATTAPDDAVPYLDTGLFTFKYGSENGRYIDAQYVTSTEYVSTVMNREECFFGVNFADGRIKCYPQNPHQERTYYARYVRGKLYGINTFQDNGDRTISDQATDLTWMQSDSGDSQFSDSLTEYDHQDGSLKWEEALDFCEDLSLAGQDDWRLPNAKELQSIVDYRRSPATSNSAAIDSVFESTAIQDEKSERNYPCYWTSTTLLDGRVLGSDAVVIAFGEAIGQMQTPGSTQMQVMDVHGAGAQRSDSKTGSASIGNGPQGDARRVYNYVRCVRGAAVSVAEDTSAEESVSTHPQQNTLQKPQQSVSRQNQMQQRSQNEPPEEAIAACQNAHSDDPCSIQTQTGSINGSCRQLQNQLVCVPENGSRTE